MSPKSDIFGSRGGHKVILEPDRDQDPRRSDDPRVVSRSP